MGKINSILICADRKIQLTLCILIFISSTLYATEVEKWGYHEITLQGTSKGILARLHINNATC